MTHKRGFQCVWKYNKQIQEVLAGRPQLRKSRVWREEHVHMHSSCRAATAFSLTNSHVDSNISQFLGSQILFNVFEPFLH